MVPRYVLSAQVSEDTVPFLEPMVGTKSQAQVPEGFSSQVRKITLTPFLSLEMFSISPACISITLKISFRLPQRNASAPVPWLRFDPFVKYTPLVG